MNAAIKHSTELSDLSPASRYDVVIIGAGIAGCAAAQALALADTSGRRRILLIDRHPGSSPRFAGEFIHPRGAQILDDLGFYGALKAAGAVDVDGFTVLERADGRYVELPYDDIPEYRTQGLASHHKTLVKTMRQVVRERPQVDLFEGWIITDLVRSGERVAGVVLTGPGNRTVKIHADLVIGADGKASQVRKLAGIPDQRQTVGFTVGLELRNAKLPGRTWGNIILGAWGPVLVYPISHEPNGDLLYRVTLDLPANLPAKGARLAEFLLETFVPFLPQPLADQIAHAITSHKGPFEMAPTVNLPAPTAVQPGLALIGDAGGCSHPITASGMTMGLRDAECLGEEARRREDAPVHEAWVDDSSLRRYRAEHDRYVPTRQALADAIYEVFRGGNEGARAIQRALFEYWASGKTARARSMALLSCAEGRPQVFLTEYLKAARYAIESSLVARHAAHLPTRDRLRQVSGAMHLASNKLGLVAQVMWAQVRPAWLPHDRTFI
ncbi:MAG TPA: FAD-dependent oxidoreductase [Nannocystis sp.]|jgi:2-polyprenyl-6-methoxyphenol hydroxylase-like FAD-dependent oxidoreductase